MATARYRDDSEVAPVAAPRGNDAYTGMLIISLAAMILGCILLLLEFFSYDSQTKPPSVSLPALPKVGATPAAPPQAGTPPAPGVPGVPPPAPGR